MNPNNRKLYRKKSIKENINDLLNEDGLLLSKIPLLDYSTLKKLRGLQPSSEMYEYNYSNNAMLIAELKKVIAPKKDKANENSSKENESKINSSANGFKNLETKRYPKRNNEIIVRCIKQFPTFIEYMKFHNISNDLLEKISPFLKHKQIMKGEYLFKEDKKPNFFFGVINGKISLRTFDENFILENKRKFDNEELNMKNIYIFKKKSDILKVTEENNEIKNLNSNSPGKTIGKNDNNNHNNNNNNNKRNSINNNNNKQNNNKEEKEEKIEINKIDIDENTIIEIYFENIPGIEKYLKEGYELKLLKRGDCYGIEELLTNQKNPINALAIENTDIFYIEKEFFDKFLLNSVSRIDLERKYIINKLIPIPMELLMNIRPEIYDNNHIIYTEFDYAFEAIYIYKGSAELKKYPSAKTKSDIYEHKNILKTVSKIGEGGIAGWEICKGPDNFYESTLVTTDHRTIIYRINILDINERRRTTRNNIKKFFTSLYEHQKVYLTKAEEKSKEYSEIYNISNKKVKPKINYTEFFDKVFKNVNPPNKLKKNKLSNYKLKLNIEANNSNKKISSKISIQFNNKALSSNGLKTIDYKKSGKNNYYISATQNKEQKKYTIFSLKSRNEEEKNIQSFNSINMYNTLSSPSKLKNKNQIITISQDYNTNGENTTNTNHKPLPYLYGKEIQNSYDLSFPKLFKYKSSKTTKKIFMNKTQHEKHKKLNSMKKNLYNSGEFKIPFVSLSDKNKTLLISKIKNLRHYSDFKKLILDNKLVN